MAFVDDAALASRIDGAIKKFREGEKTAIASIETIQQRVSNAEENIRKAQGIGLPIGTGPFSSGYFEPRLKVAVPLAERAKRFSQSRTKTGNVIAELEGYKPIFDDNNNFIKYVVRTE